MANKIDAAASAMPPKNNAYDALNTFFKANEGVVVEIEILPSALAPTETPILEDGISIGIPKKVLVQAYLKARTLFLLRDQNSPSEALALEATRIILLFDPEHLTAANFRKKKIVTIQKETTRESTNSLVTTAQEELRFLDSILTSHLHRQSKSPTLWYHRYWLFSNLMLTITSYNSSDELYTSLVKPEFDTIFKAGEQHPKNYYAWQYARRLIESLMLISPRSKAQNNGVQLDIQDIIKPSALRVKDWCLRHPSDTSSWSFLLFILRYVDDLSTRKDIVSNILDLTFGFRWQHESLWVFVRTVLSDPTILADDQAPFIERLYTYEKEKNGYTTSASSALRWIETNKITIP